MPVNAIPWVTPSGDPVDFTNVGLSECQQIANEWKDEETAAAWEFYNGNHWQDADGWVGARPPDNATNAGEIMAEIEHGFVSENIVREISQRHTAGCTGREPHWRFAPVRPLGPEESPDASEQAQIDEAEAALTPWWDENDLATVFADAATALALGGRVMLRVSVPETDVTPDGAVRAIDAATALDRIFVDIAPPESGGMVYDPASRRQAGMFLYVRGDEQRAELSYIDQTVTGPDGTPGPTTIRVIGQSGDVATPVALPLGGRLLMFEARRDRLITTQVMQGQRALNLSETQMLRNVNLAGSLERMIMNGLPPGQWIERETGQPWVDGTSTGTRVFRASPLPVGPSITNFIMGAPVTDASGQVVGMTNPSVSYRDPVDVTTFVNTRGQYYEAMLGQCQQIHAIISGDGTASGESRRQARAEFEASLMASARALSALGRWMMETALALAAYLSGKPEGFNLIRCDFTPTLDAGPLTSPELTEVRNQWKDGLISHETALSAIGIEDPDAEIARINEEESAKSSTDVALIGALRAPAPVEGNLIPPVENPPPPAANEAAA